MVLGVQTCDQTRNVEGGMSDQAIVDPKVGTELPKGLIQNYVVGGMSDLGHAETKVFRVEDESC